jgi:hypothetical protein
MPDNPALPGVTSDTGQFNNVTTTPVTPPNNNVTTNTEQADKTTNEKKGMDISKTEYTADFEISGEPTMTNRSIMYLDNYREGYINGVWEFSRVTHRFGDTPFTTSPSCRKVDLPTRIDNLQELIKAHQDTLKYNKIQKISNDPGESGAPNQVNRSIKVVGYDLKAIGSAGEDYE